MSSTVNYQVGAGADDGYWIVDVFANDAEDGDICGDYFGDPFTLFLRFTGVTIPVGATITASKIQLYYRFSEEYDEGADPKCTIYADDQANPSAVSSVSDGDGRTKTTASVAADLPESGTWWDSPELKTIIQELVNSYSYASGSAMQFLLPGNPAGAGCIFIHSYDTAPLKAAKLSITYTEEATGNPHYAYAQQ